MYNFKQYLLFIFMLLLLLLLLLFIYLFIYLFSIFLGPLWKSLLWIGLPNKILVINKSEVLFLPYPQ